MHSFISAILFHALEFYLISNLCLGKLSNLYKLLLLIGNNWLLFSFEINFCTKSNLTFLHIVVPRIHSMFQKISHVSVGLHTEPFLGLGTSKNNGI